ncbi:MAG: ABC transporter permease subunit [Limnochordia bacterium]|jgi:simple sugar transport system permease protein
MGELKKFLNQFGFARVIIAGFFLFLCGAAVVLDLNLAELITSSLVRIGMWGVLVLAMLPAIVSGIGPNFGVSLGILCGLVGGLTALEIAYRVEETMTIAGGNLFLLAIILSLPFAIAVGIGYGWLLNRVKGSEMMIATYVGFSMVSIMKLAWLFLPFTSPEMAWPIGRGVRVQIALENRGMAGVLNNFWSFNIGDVTVPTGLLLFFAFCCWLVWLFMRSKTGTALYAAGANPRFAEAAGINVDQQRIIGTILSTILGAVGILVYAQSYGFLQLYEGPMLMPFVAVAAVLIGGAGVNRATISHVVIGTILFLGIQVVAIPVANAFAADWSSMGEIGRKVIQNGVILYALTQAGGE